MRITGPLAYTCEKTDKGSTKLSHYSWACQDVSGRIRNINEEWKERSFKKKCVEGIKQYPKIIITACIALDGTVIPVRGGQDELSIHSGSMFNTSICLVQ